MRLHTVRSGDWRDYRTIRLAALREAPTAFESTYGEEAACATRTGGSAPAPERRARRPRSCSSAMTPTGGSVWPAVTDPIARTVASKNGSPIRSNPVDPTTIVRMTPAATRASMSWREVRTENSREPKMTIVWFIVWLIANNIGGHEPLLFNPVNAWTATLILAIGLDLGGAHARSTQKGR